jgi:hypothetical protein
MDDGGQAVTALAFFCSRCSARFEPLGARVEVERVCPACEFRSARAPLATQRLESCRHRGDDSLLQGNWIDTLPSQANMRDPEILLKVVVHLAGIAALFAFLGEHLGVAL